MNESSLGGILWVVLVLAAILAVWMDRTHPFSIHVIKNFPSPR
jgi:hypothetical protein